MDLSFTQRGRDIQAEVARIVHDLLLPLHERWAAETHAKPGRPSFVVDLQREMRERGLWNMGLVELPPEIFGTPLGSLDFAPIAEVTARLPWAAQVFNCHAPDLPNMVMLNVLATPDQRVEFLDPLLAGETSSAFSMTEPAVASSDATNIATRISRDGDDYVINGRKWFITGAAGVNTAFHVVMGVTEPDGPRTERHSMVLVPANATGIRVERSLRFLGWEDHVAPIGEITYTDVRVPVANLLGQEGRGFEAAQVRLGPARIHHAMRCVGLAEMLLDLMKARSLNRHAFGAGLGDFTSVQHWIAEARIEIEHARLFIHFAAAKLDCDGFKQSWRHVSMAKVNVARMLQKIADRAIQLFGAAGGSDDLLIHHAFVYARMFRIADGPDEVHLRQIFRAEMAEMPAGKAA